MLDASLIWKSRSRASGGLYMGGFPFDFPVVGAFGFDLLVLCAAERLAWLGNPTEAESAEAYGCRTLHTPFDDDMVSPEVVEQATRATAVVSDALLHDKKVLVTCNEGRNRSGLITALTLLQLLPNLSAGQVIDLIRARRAAPNGRQALTNAGFCELIAAWPR